MSSTNKMVSHSFIYMMGDVLRYSVSLVMLPIYTRYLTPADYGIVELLTMLIDFAGIIFGARVNQSIFRFYCTAENKSDKNTIISSALFLGGLFNGIGAIAVATLSAPLSMAIFSHHLYTNYIILLAIDMFLLPLTELPLIHIRVQQRPWLFFSFSVLKLAIQVTLNIYFVVMREMHVEGVIYSAVLSSLVMAVLLTGYSLYTAGIRVRFSVCKKLFSFSLPLKTQCHSDLPKGFPVHQFISNIVRAMHFPVCQGSAENHGGPCLLGCLQCRSGHYSCLPDSGMDHVLQFRDSSQEENHANRLRRTYRCNCNYDCLLHSDPGIWGSGCRLGHCHRL
jgi:hypothetical protein